MYFIEANHLDSYTCFCWIETEAWKKLASRYKIDFIPVFIFQYYSSFQNNDNVIKKLNTINYNNIDLR